MGVSCFVIANEFKFAPYLTSINKCKCVLLNGCISNPVISFFFLLGLTTIIIIFILAELRTTAEKDKYADT